MKELEVLLNKRWVLKSRDKEMYYKIRDALGELRKFTTEKMGCQIIDNSLLIKMEKIPVIPESFMGIQKFSSKEEYAYLCILLMFLEDRDAQEQFILSQLTEYITANLPGDISDWTLYTNRRKLIRVLRFAVDQGMVDVTDGKDEAFMDDEAGEVLYENTGASRYFMKNFSKDIMEYTKPEDFQESDWFEVDEDRGFARRHRVYKRLIFAPGMYKEDGSPEDFEYLKYYGRRLSEELEQIFDCQVHIHRGSAYLLSGDECRMGTVFPGNNSISDILLLCFGEIRKKIENGEWKTVADESCLTDRIEFENLIKEVKQEYGSGFSKNYREMPEGEFVKNVIDAMELWMFIRKEKAAHAGHVRSYLEPDVKALDKDSVIRDLNKVYFENRGFLTDYHLMQNELFAEAEQTEFPAKRLDISARYQGVKISFSSLLTHLEEDIEELENLIKDGDRELFEDILANTVSRKIRGKINASNTWVQKMNSLMNGMNTSSGLKLSLRWRSKTAEQEDQLDTKELVDLLKKDYRLMSEEEASRLSAHFRSKVAEARRNARDSAGMISFYQIMKDTLDYRKWFEFQLFSQKNGERQKELTNSVFGTFSGGEKAMSMYVPLFSAVVAKYQGGREDAPRLISLDEAFAGVDNKNIRDMFRLMTEFGFDFIINSQVLWGDCDTLDALAIYQLIRPGNAKFVTVMPYLWNGKKKELLEREEEVEQRGAEIGQQ